MFDSTMFQAKQEASPAFYNYSIEDSVRLDQTDGAWFTRTPGATGDRQKYTTSFWIKLSSMGNNRSLFGGKEASSDHAHIYITTTNTLRVAEDTPNYGAETGFVFRDITAWYHVVIAFDSTQATAADRCKIYINGTQVSTSSVGAGYWPLNHNTRWNTSGNLHKVGSWNDFATERPFDGYLADVYWIDGTVYDADTFGELKNGVWVPKNPTLTYGTNGFNLKFAGDATDSSGNGNNFTAVDVGTHDYVLDGPTNNFPVMNYEFNIQNSHSYRQGSLQVTTPTGFGSSAATFAIPPNTGKYYWETRIGTVVAGAMIGLCDVDKIDGNTDYPGRDTYSYGYYSSGDKYNSGTGAAYGASFTTGDIIGIAYDSDTLDLTYYKNGVSQGSAFTVTSGTYYPVVGDGSSGSGGDVVIMNFGQDSSFVGNETRQNNVDGAGYGDFYYTVPSGYRALCSANLPEPTIGPNSLTQSDDHNGTLLYTGNNPTGQSITGLGFQSDFLWIAERGNVESKNMFDSVRGLGTGAVYSNLPNSEISFNAIASNADGFTINAGTWDVNTTSDTFVAWNWKADNTSGSSNANGTITSTVAANQDAGFSIVAYTGTGANATVGHGLSSAPEIILLKNRSAADDWRVYSLNATTDPETDYLVLNSTAVPADLNTVWNDTAPTSTVFSIGTDNAVNTNTENYIAYCWHSVPGYSKVQTYVGNGSASGAFVYTGFRPSWLLIKDLSGTEQWYVVDAARSPTNEVDIYTIVNLTDAEATADIATFYANGFKLRNTGGINLSGRNYLYMAFAEAPFKYANAR